MESIRKSIRKLRSLKNYLDNLTRTFRKLLRIFKNCIKFFKLPIIIIMYKKYIEKLNAFGFTDLRL